MIPISFILIHIPNIAICLHQNISILSIIFPILLLPLCLHFLIGHSLTLILANNIDILLPVPSGTQITNNKPNNHQQPNNTSDENQQNQPVIYPQFLKYPLIKETIPLLRLLWIRRSRNIYLWNYRQILFILYLMLSTGISFQYKPIITNLTDFWQSTSMAVVDLTREVQSYQPVVGTSSQVFVPIWQIVELIRDCL